MSKKGKDLADMMNRSRDVVAVAIKDLVIPGADDVGQDLQGGSIIALLMPEGYGEHPQGCRSIALLSANESILGLMGWFPRLEYVKKWESAPAYRDILYRNVAIQCHCERPDCFGFSTGYCVGGGFDPKKKEWVVQVMCINGNGVADQIGYPVERVAPISRSAIDGLFPSKPTEARHGG